jgi:hypothetical protein
MPPLLRRFLVALLLGGLYAAAPIHAQSGPPRSPEQADVQAVRVTIDALFDGMRAGDSAAVRQPRDAAWDERSHCGTNALHLVRRGDAWRIQHIAYTCRQDCTVPSEVRKEEFLPGRTIRPRPVRSAPVHRRGGGHPGSDDAPPSMKAPSRVRAEEALRRPPPADRGKIGPLFCPLPPDLGESRGAGRAGAQSRRRAVSRC